MKVADIKLKWKRSASSDAATIRLTITNGGQETTIEAPIETEEQQITVSANTPFGFSLVTIDSEGLESVALTYSSTLGDLTNPLPATDAGHEIVAIRDVPDAGPAA